ncbi:uncharacterized protein FIESC28_06225 [Fusarium coffeatum]|uniref:AAA+ ATPase domain-containing protein n=1 Tax=Fusarium coffeatum TaxID=231269 RepID=A0A366RLZ8_9HYPO|nr:uncharacterized protein FIESC28_06225 [Fusarium coffeatum]RBR18159.1 hypothetical protein FIESC28_06225 [Fusarium coffeatum]
MEIVGVIAAVPGLIDIIKAVSTGVRGLRKGKVTAKTTQDLLTQLQDLESILQDIQNKWKNGGVDQLRLQRLSPPLKQLKVELSSLRTLLQNSEITKEPARYLKRAFFLSTRLDKSLNEAFTRLSQLEISLTLLIAHGQNAVTRDLEIRSFTTRRLELQSLLQPAGSSFIPDKTAGTCDWIWSHTTFCDWMQNSAIAPDSYLDRILCIVGIKGCGKSVLVKAIAGEFGIRKKTALHFSFWSGSEAQQKLTNLLRTLVWQILGYIKDENLERISEPLGKSAVVDTQVLTGVLHIALSLIHGKVYVIIDGVDESSDDWNNESEGSLSTVLNLAKNHNNLHVLLSGRESSLRTILKRNCPRLEITDRLIRNDLLKVISVELDTSLAIHSQSVRDMIQASLESRSQIMFLWVTLALRELRRCFSVEEVKETLKQVPHDLDREYHRLFARLMTRTGGTVIRPSVTMKRARYLLYSLLACPEPMTVQDLCYAYASQCNSDGPVDDDLITTDGIADACGDLVAVTDGRCHLIHASVSEFLMRPQQEWDHEDSGISYFRVDLSVAHESMRSACFKYIESIDLGYPLTDDGALSLSQRFPFILYVSNYLPFHLSQVQNRKRRSPKESFSSFGTHQFCVFFEYLLVMFSDSILSQQADIVSWTQSVMGEIALEDLTEHFKSELRRRLQLFGVQHERYKSWLNLAIFFLNDNDEPVVPYRKAAGTVSRKGQPMEASNKTVLSALPEHITNSYGLPAQRLSQSLGAVSKMFKSLESSTVALVASSAKPLSPPLILMAARVAAKQNRWPLAERLAAVSMAKTLGHRDFYEFCSLLNLAAIKMHGFEDYGEETERLVDKLIEIANCLLVRPQTEFLKVEAYNLQIQIRARTDRPEQAVESAKSLEKIVGKQREKCRSLVWDYSLGHTRGGFAYRVNWLRKTAFWLENAGEHAAAAVIAGQGIDVFNESGAEPTTAILHLYNIRLNALHLSGGFNELISTCDKYIEVFESVGSKANDIHIHIRWRVQAFRSSAFAAIGDEEESIRYCIEATDEVKRLGIQKVQAVYELSLVSMAKGLAHFCQYDRSMALSRELLEVKEVTVTMKSLDQHTTLGVIRPLVSKLENVGLMKPGYDEFLHCYSLIYLIDDSEGLDEADWWETQAIFSTETIPMFKDRTTLLTLKYIETCLRCSNNLDRACEGYAMLGQIYFNEGDLEATNLVSSDATSRLLSGSSLRSFSSYMKVGEIWLSGGDVAKSKSWIDLAYETKPQKSSSDWAFANELWFASMLGYFIDTYGDQLESVDKRESFIEQSWVHLLRAIEEDKNLERLRARNRCVRCELESRGNEENDHHDDEMTGDCCTDVGVQIESDDDYDDNSYGSCENGYSLEDVYESKEERDDRIQIGEGRGIRAEEVEEAE